MHTNQQIVSFDKRIIITYIPLFALFVLMSIALWYLLSSPGLETGPENVQGVSQKRSMLGGTNVEEITEFQLRIPKLKIDVAIIPNVDGNDDDAYTEALSKGVAHYSGTALPGWGSNIFIFGHSSSPIKKKGFYDKVFSKLNSLLTGDEIVITFNNKEFRYYVSEKKIVQPEDISVLDPTDGEQLSLMTCWPIGTNKKRLIVISKPLQ